MHTHTHIPSNLKYYDQSLLFQNDSRIQNMKNFCSMSLKTKLTLTHDQPSQHLNLPYTKQNFLCWVETFKISIDIQHAIHAATDSSL